MFKENMISTIAIIVAIIIGLVLQFQFDLPPLVAAVLAILWAFL